MNSASNKMDANLTGMWVSFFTAASIPSDVAATYALTFAENRIQSDMLLDLNKEYLRDMGITRMGDVIAILRHAKCVHESAARDRVLSSAVVAKVPVAAVTGRSTAAAPQPTTQTPASRILERYTRNPAPPPETSPPGKRKLNTGTNTEDNVKKSRLIRFEAATSAASKEGPLAKQAPVPAKQTVTMNKQTVFARLGNTEPVIMTKTITTAKTTKSEPKPIYARLGSKSEAEVRDIPIQVDALKYEGILKGNPAPKKIVTVTTSSNNVRKIAMGTGKSTVVAMAPVRLATAGKVTMTPGRVAMTTGKVSLSTGCTMRADETPVSVKDKLALPKSVKFSSKVEYKEIETIKKLPLPVRPKFTPVFNKPERRLSMPETDETSSLKTRLGMKKGKSLTITKNVFDRLGV